MKKLIIALTIFATLFFNSKNTLATENKPLIVTTIKPIFSLAKAIVGDSADVELLIKDNTSPHDFHLKPSHIKALQKADIIFYIDKNFENFLTNSLKNISLNVKKYPLSKSSISYLNTRYAGIWKDAQSSKQLDIHFWLSANNAKKIAQYIAEKLSENYPQNKKTYMENFSKLEKRLDILNKNLEITLSDLQNKPFVVFHDSYQYFEKSYDLEAIGSITSDLNEFSSAAKIKEIREEIKNKKIFCIFSEPQFSNKLTKTIIENSDVKMRILDPLGNNLKEDENLYFNLMNNLANDFKNCLKA